MVPPWFLQPSIPTGRDLKNEQASIPSRTQRPLLRILWPRECQPRTDAVIVNGLQVGAPPRRPLASRPSGYDPSRESMGALRQSRLLELFPVLLPLQLLIHVGRISACSSSWWASLTRIPSGHTVSATVPRLRPTCRAA